MNEAEAPAATLEVGPAGSESVDPSAGVGTRPRRRVAWLPAGAAAFVGVLSLLVPIGWSGLWSPHELDMADLSRRIAVALHGAEELAIAGADNRVPTLAELGKGQLPFSSVAVGFQLFGLSDWAGRLPLALWALLGLAATYLLVARFKDGIAAAYATLVTATVPLYFIHARTLLGDGVTLAATALASAGLAIATFDARIERTRTRLSFGALGLVGLLAGFAARGVLFGVAGPALGVGLAWAIWRLAGRRCPSTAGNALGAISLALGLIALGTGIWTVLGESPAMYLELLGSRFSVPGKLPTHDALLHQLGFALFPWSALAPFALALALSPADENAPDAALRLCLATVFLVALLAHGLGAAYVGSLPFTGTFALAALLGLSLRDAEEQAKGTRLLALGAAALCVVFCMDLRGDPEQALMPFAVRGAKFPESFAEQAQTWVELGALCALALLVLCFAELPNRPPSSWFSPDADYRRWWRTLHRASRRRAVVGGVAVFALLAVLPVRPLAAAGLPGEVVQALSGSRQLALVALLGSGVVVAGPVVVWAARDLVGAFLHWLPVTRARLAVAGFTALGLGASLIYYPTLAAHLSPRNVFESFASRARPGEPLAVLGQVARVAPYYSRADIHVPKSSRDGLDWLLAEPDERRWLVFGARDLGQLNNLHRQKTTRNLPILDAISSEVLLASNQLGEQEQNQNPLSTWLDDERPAPQHELDVNLNDQLRCLGWAITDPEGRPVARVRAGQPYDFRIYWEVLAPVSGRWKTFIHIDGHRRRYNGDHDTLEGKYPFRFWQPGDFVTDIHRIELEPHFGGMTYQVYFGLFSGQKRLPVKAGKHHENRIMGGSLAVD